LVIFAMDARINALAVLVIFMKGIGVCAALYDGSNVSSAILWQAQTGFSYCGCLRWCRADWASACLGLKCFHYSSLLFCRYSVNMSK
jgi:hypothetical protein